MHSSRLPVRSVWLVQLPIPPLGPEPIRGNVPLAAAYLKLWAENQVLGSYYDIPLFPPPRPRCLAIGLEPLNEIAAIVWRDGVITKLEANEFAMSDCMFATCEPEAFQV